MYHSPEASGNPTSARHMAAIPIGEILLCLPQSNLFSAKAYSMNHTASQDRFITIYEYQLLYQKPFLTVHRTLSRGTNI